jgi:hypothetical protein
MANRQMWLIILHIRTNILNKMNGQTYQLKKSVSNSVYIGFIKLENSSQLAAKKITVHALKFRWQDNNANKTNVGHNSCTQHRNESTSQLHSVIPSLHNQL